MVIKSFHPSEDFLANRSAHSMIGYWHDSVCLSVYLSVHLLVTLSIVANDTMILQQKCLNK